MRHEDIIKQKLLTTWPKSWAIFEESCAYSIKHGLDFVVGILLNEEKEITHKDRANVWEQLCSYLGTLGYKNISGNGDQFATKDGYRRGLGFVVFLSVAGIKAYLEEIDRHTKWYNEGRFGEEPKRPLYQKMRFINIYKE